MGAKLFMWEEGEIQKSVICGGHTQTRPSTLLSTWTWVTGRYNWSCSSFPRSCWYKAHHFLIVERLNIEGAVHHRLSLFFNVSCGEQPSSLKQNEPQVSSLSPVFLFCCSHKSLLSLSMVFCRLQYSRRRRRGRRVGAIEEMKDMIWTEKWLILTIDTWRPNSQHLFTPIRPNPKAKRFNKKARALFVCYFHPLHHFSPVK